MPARSRPSVVVANVARLEQEMIADAVRELGLIHLTMRVGLEGDNVVFSVREIKPILSAVVEPYPKASHLRECLRFLIMRTDQESRAVNEYARSFLRRYAPQLVAAKQMDLPLAA